MSEQHAHSNPDKLGAESKTSSDKHPGCFYCTDEYKAYMKEICKLKVSTVYLDNEQDTRPLLCCTE